MVKTGGSIFIALSLVVMLLSLLPVCLFFARKAIATPVLTTLKFLCSFVFLQYGTLQFVQPGAAVLQTAFHLVTFTLSFYFIRLLMPAKPVKDIMALFLVSFLSVVITIYSLQGINANACIINIIQACLITVLTIILLFQLITNPRVVLASEPAFYIAGGLLCYYAMVLFMEAIAGHRSNLPQTVVQEKAIIMGMADVLRMIFFIVAVVVARQYAVGSRQS